MNEAQKYFYGNKNIENQIEQKLDSREVAEMMEISHTNLLQKIDGINEDFRKMNIQFSKYWEESSYQVVGQTRSYRCFLITKRGCEFLAHKTTGTKGNLFTDRYMDRFAEMEQQLQAINPVGLHDVDKFFGGTQAVLQMFPGMVNGLNKMIGLVQDTVKVKDSQIDKALDLVGMRSKNVTTLTNHLKKVLGNKHRMNVTANMEVYLKAKRKIFEEYGVTKWEEIPVLKYNEVMAFIEEAV